MAKDGKTKLDFQAYLDQYNEKKAPDFITVQLEVNDIFYAKDNNIDNVIEMIFKDVDILLGEFRRAAPDTIIGVGLVTPGAKSQDAFCANYNCAYTRWQYKKISIE